MKRSLALFVVTVLGMAMSARADVIRVFYTAKVATVVGQPFGLTVPLQTPVSGYFQYDTSTPDTNGSATSGTYAHASDGGFVAYLLGHRIEGSETPTWTVSQNDTLRVYDGPRTVGPEGGDMAFDSVTNTNIQLFVAITPSNSSLLPNDDLPNPWPAFVFGALGDPHTFSLQSSAGNLMLLQFTSTSQLAINWVARELEVGIDGTLRVLWDHLSGGEPDGQVALWTLNSNCVYQASQAMGPYAGWVADDLVLSKFDNTPHLVWLSDSGEVSVWDFNTAGSFQSAQTYGPVSGWSYAQLSISPVDGGRELFWISDTQAASLWRFDSSAQFQGAQAFGPFTDWYPVTVAISPVDSKRRLVWLNSDGTTSVWRLSSTDVFEAAHAFGPVTDWYPVRLEIGPVDNKPRLLWQNAANGAASIWRLSTADAFETATSYGPFTGWTVLDALLPRPDGKSMLPWDGGAGALSLWTLSSADGFDSAVTFGPYAGWSAIDGGVDGANKSYILWNNDNGSISLWRLSSTGDFETAVSYGPY